MKKEDQYWAFIAIIFFLIILLASSIYEQVITKRNLQEKIAQCKEDFSFAAVERKTYGETINVTCKIPKEILDKNLPYQVFVIANNKTCEIERLKV